MEILMVTAQLILAVSILVVWVFRFENIVLEFQYFGLSVLTRSVIGTTKIVLATLLVVGIWYESLVFVPSLLLGLLMLGAQYYHFKVKNPLQKRIPSLVLFLLCLFLLSVSSFLLS